MKKLLVLSVALMMATLSSQAREKAFFSTEAVAVESAKFYSLTGDKNRKKEIKKKKKQLNNQEQGLKKQAKILNQEQKLLKKEVRLIKEQERLAKKEKKYNKAQKNLEKKRNKSKKA